MLSKLHAKNISVDIRIVNNNLVILCQAIISCCFELFSVGAGDFCVQQMSCLPDPCPLPEKLKKRSLNEKERLIYAPMSGVGGILYDSDAIYIDIGGSHTLKDDDVSIASSRLAHF